MTDQELFDLPRKARLGTSTRKWLAGVNVVDGITELEPAI